MAKKRSRRMVIYAKSDWHFNLYRPPFLSYSPCIPPKWPKADLSKLLFWMVTNGLARGEETYWETRNLYFKITLFVSCQETHVHLLSPISIGLLANSPFSAINQTNVHLMRLIIRWAHHVHLITQIYCLSLPGTVTFAERSDLHRKINILSVWHGYKLEW